MNKQVQVDLNAKLRVADGDGGFAELESVNLVCANQSLINEEDVIVNAFFKAIAATQSKLVNQSNNEAQEAEGDLDPKAVMFVLRAGVGVKDMQAMRSSFKKMLSGGCLKCDGVARVNMGLVDKFSNADMNAMLGAYIANFIEF